MAWRLAERHLRTFASGGSKSPAALAGGAKMHLACQLRSIAVDFQLGCKKVALVRSSLLYLGHGGSALHFDENFRNLGSALKSTGVPPLTLHLAGS